MKTLSENLLPAERQFLEKIIYEVSKVTDVNVSLIKEKGRHRHIVIARHIYFYVANKLKPFKISYERIGSLVGKDHASVMHGIKKIEQDIEVGYPLTIEALKVFKIIRTTYNEYQLVWEVPNLISVLKGENELNINIILETNKIF